MSPTSDLILDDADRAMLHGEAGPGAAFAMRVLTRFAAAVGARSLIGIQGAHIDGCLYHGQASLDFVERFAGSGARVRVPTTLNVGSLDLIHPDLVRMPAADAGKSRRLMEAHLELGCQPSFTCAPYQTLFRPRFGEQVAWGESNAIAFANSVIGARTARYGDFIDLCCAVTGRAPAWSLHLDENRLGEMLFRLTGFPASAGAGDALFVAVGLIVGARCGDRVPVIQGLPGRENPDTEGQDIGTEDRLKALGAAAASSGAVALFHAVGLTPEAPDFAAAFGGRAPLATVDITPEDVAAALAHLSQAPDGAPLAAVCLGTPHFSLAEWRRLAAALADAGECRAPIYVNTARDTLRQVRADPDLAWMIGRGVTPVTDTCTYITPILRDVSGAVMTNSGKWAHYAPGNIGVQVAFGSLADCVASAVAGQVVRAE